MAAPALRAEEPFRIEGVVRDQESGAPISGARVYASGGGKSYDLKSPGEVTGADGTFSLEVEKPTGYFVRAQADGYLQSPERPTADMLAVLGPTQRTAKVRLFLSRAAALSGRVVDVETGQPLEQIEVRPSLVRWEYGRRILEQPGAAVVTRALGTFRIDQLRAGEYVLLARSREDRATIVSDSDPLDAPDLSGYGVDSATTFRLNWGADLQLPDIRISKRRLYRIRGKLEAQNCEEGRTYRLSLSQVFGPQNMIRAGETVQNCKSVFTIRSLGPGNYRIDAHANEPASVKRAQASASVAVSGDVEVNVAPAPPMEIRGAMRYPEGFPPDSRRKLWLKVDVLGDSGFSARVRYEEPLTDFQVGVFPGSSYRLRIGGLPPPFYVTEILLNGAAIAASVFELVGHLPAQTIDVIVSAKGGILRGQVFDKEKAFPSASVVVVDDPIRYEAGFPVHWTVDADQDGRFSFPALPPGSDLVVGVQEFGWRELHKPGVLAALAEGGQRVRLSPEAFVEIALELRWVGQ
jgi:hypothetical protein